MTWKTRLFFKTEEGYHSAMNKGKKLTNFLNEENIEEFTVLTSKDAYIEIIYKVNN